MQANVRVQMHAYMKYIYTYIYIHTHTYIRTHIHNSLQAKSLERLFLERELDRVRNEELQIASQFQAAPPPYYGDTSAPPPPQGIILQSPFTNPTYVAHVASTPVARVASVASTSPVLLGVNGSVAHVQGHNMTTTSPMHGHNNLNGHNGGQTSAATSNYGNTGANAKPGVVQPGSRLIGNVRLWLRVSSLCLDMDTVHARRLYMHVCV